MSSPRPHTRPLLHLLALHDAALLLLAFYLPIYWGTFNTSVAKFGPGEGRTGFSGLLLASVLVSLAALCALAWRWSQRRAPAVLPNAIHLPALLFLAISALATLTSASHYASLLELTRILAGVVSFVLVANRALLPEAPLTPVLGIFCASLPFVFLTHTTAQAGLGLYLNLLIWLAGAGVVAFHFAERAHPNPPRRWLEALVLTSGVAVSAWGIREKVFMATLPQNSGWEIFSTFFNPNPLGGYLALLLPLALALALTARLLWQRLALGFSALLLLIALPLTGSKGAYVGLFVAALIFVFLLARLSARPKRAVRLVLGGCVLAALAVALPLLLSPALHAKVLAVFSPQSAPNMFRILTWKGTWIMALRNPVLGIGPGAFESVFTTYAVADFTRQAHQNFLQVAAEQGLAGGLIFLWLWGAVLFTGWRLVKDAGRSRADRLLAAGMMSSLVVFLVHSLFDYDWYIGAVGQALWLSAGALAFTAHGRALAPVASPAPSEPVKLGRAKKRRLTEPAPAVALPESGLHLLPWPRTETGRGLALFAVATGLVLAIRVAGNGALAQLARDNGDAQMAAAQTAQAQALSQPADLQLATAYFDQGVEDYRKATEYAPGWADAHDMYATALSVQAPEQAEQEYRKAIALEPRSCKYWKSLGGFYARDTQRNRLPEAVKAYQQALARWPQDAKTLRALAETYQRLGQEEEAARTYQRLLDLEDRPINQYPALSQDTNVETNYAFAHYEIGRRALRAYTRGHRWDDLEQAEKHLLASWKVIQDYRGGGAKTDRMFALAGRPMTVRGLELNTLAPKIHYRLWQVYVLMNRPEQAAAARAYAEEKFAAHPDAKQQVAQEDAGGAR